MAEQICTRCVMDSSDPGIEFDENGVCSACKQYMHSRELSGYHPGESEKKLQETVAMMKENSKDSDYDCVLGISGGVDSAYMAYLPISWDCGCWPSMWTPAGTARWPSAISKRCAKS